MFAHRPIAFAVCAGALAAPAGADAATVSVRQDGAAEPLPVAGLTTRDPNPELVLGFGGGEMSYSLEVRGPGDQPAASAVDCADAGGGASKRLAYVGNGAYRVVLRTYPLVGCAGSGRDQRQTFSIDARDAIVAPGAAVMLRAPYSYEYAEQRFGVDLAPGATSHEVVYARNATIGADGGIVGEREPAAILDGKAEMLFLKPGTYTLLARASGLGLDGAPLPGPWSAPLRLAVLAPFDLEQTQYLDSTGPSYMVRLMVRERSATGRVRVTAAYGARGRRFRSLGVATLRAGTLTERFRLARRGSYRLRFAFAGSDTVAPGTITLPIKIR